MRTFIVIVLLVAWFSPLSGEELAISTAAPAWNMASAGKPWVYDLNAAGGQAPYAWRVAEGSLPPGVHLVDLATVQWGSPSRTGLFGVATEPGRWPVKVTVTDAAGRVAEAWWTIEVSPLALDVSRPVLQCDAESHWSLTAVGAAGVARFGLGPEGYLPLGLTLNAGGALIGTPRLPGKYELPVEIRDEAERTLRSLVTLSVYGKESALPPLGVRFDVEKTEVTLNVSSLAEHVLVDVDWGDGHAGSVAERATRHAYSEPGEYKVRLTVQLRDAAERVEALYPVVVVSEVPSPQE